VSALRDAAAKLVGRVSAQTLAHTQGLTQAPEELRGAWIDIRRHSDRLMAELERYEPLLSCVDAYAELKGGWPGDEEATAAARKLLEALDRFATPAAKAPRPPAPDGWKRAGDMQLPLGDREDPPSGGNPPP
jgi:hypothetical protein